MNPVSDDEEGTNNGNGKTWEKRRSRGRHMFKQWCSRKCDDLPLAAAGGGGDAGTRGTASTTRTGATCAPWPDWRLEPGDTAGECGPDYEAVPISECVYAAMIVHALGLKSAGGHPDGPAGREYARLDIS